MYTPEGEISLTKGLIANNSNISGVLFTINITTT